MYLRALFVACLFGAALSRDFPDITSLESYSTEVQLSLVKEAATVYINEYYSSEDLRGSFTIFMQGALQSVYYDNNTNEILDVNSTYCKATEVDISDYTYTPLYHGWLTTDPLIIGPSAPLRYALKNKDKLVAAGTETVRDIPCDKWELKVKNKIDNLTYQYYFAPEDWTTPYTYKKFTPIRIRVFGMSARYTDGTFTDVDQITDFAFFKPSIDDLTNLQPPIGIGCKLRDASDMLPSIPEQFKFSAEMVDLLKTDKPGEIEVQFERVMYDYPARLARIDRFTKEKGYKSSFYDFRGGAAYNRQNDGSCQMSTLRDTELVVYDLGMAGRMMTAKEYLMLDGKFYKMGKREIRGIKCDTYESVITDVSFMDKPFDKLVVTVFFIEPITRIGIEGRTESQIPAYIIVNGWSTGIESGPIKKTFSTQYSVYGFDNVAWPPMYSDFGIERCHIKPESKTYFVVVMEVGAKDAAELEDRDKDVIKSLRTTLAVHAKVPEHRIPFLKADYKTTGVFVTGVLLERPPAMLQFYKFPIKSDTTKDKLLKPILVNTLEKCAFACIDEGEFTCKGFYHCKRGCLLKSIDPFESEDAANVTNVDYCDEYIRAERESTTFRESYMDEALEYLENAILNETVVVSFEIPNGDETVIVRDIVVGDGPYTGVDAGDKPFTLNVEWRKLDAGLETTQSAIYAQTLTECYKRCKEAGSACSSFSFCPDSPKVDKDCLITSELVLKGVTPDTDLIADKYCNIYNPKFLSYYELYPGKISLIGGDKSIRSIGSLEKCAEACRKEKDFVCRGFEYCRSESTCTLHKKHILDLKPGETGSNNKCAHYAARYVADYIDLGRVLIADDSDMRYGTTLDECAKICSEEKGESCKSFNYCPQVDFTDSSCSLSKKLLRDDLVTTTEKKSCLHYEKRDAVHDWDKKNTGLNKISSAGYTKKGFTGVVIGTLVLGLIVGALGFVLYSYIRSKSSGDGLAVRFMKNET